MTYQKDDTAHYNFSFSKAEIPDRFRILLTLFHSLKV